MVTKKSVANPPNWRFPEVSQGFRSYPDAVLSVIMAAGAREVLHAFRVEPKPKYAVLDGFVRSSGDLLNRLRGPIAWENVLKESRHGQ